MAADSTPPRPPMPREAQMQAWKATWARLLGPLPTAEIGQAGTDQGSGNATPQEPVQEATGAMNGGDSGG